MASEPPSFLTLPGEILQLIIGFLDPVSLISLSQTSRSLRAVINPTHHDFVRRLLALELLPEHGGIVPLFRGRDNRLTPPWDSSEWKRNKYACCGCMKLLPHMMFDNHDILGMRYRKPPPGSIEARKAEITDWEPLEPGLRRRRILARAAQERREGQKWRRQYHLAVTGEYGVDPAAPPFAWVDPGPADAAAEEAEKYLCGTAREKRRCLECRFLYGPWMPGGWCFRNDYGMGDTPIVPSRQLKFPNILERYFPGLADPPLPPEGIPRRWRIQREFADRMLLTLYAGRCASCSTWKELGAFGIWTKPEYNPRRPLGPLVCTHCRFKGDQDPSLLARELSDAALEILRGDLSSATKNLQFGWTFVWNDFIAKHRRSAPLEAHETVKTEVVDGLKMKHDPRQLHDPVLDFDESNLPDLRRRFHRFRDFLYNEVDASTRGTLLQSWYRLWVEDYDLLESEYHWLKQQIARIESDRDLVLKYVLDRDPYRF
ncbi:hypothetical protein VTK56DRAFT_2086 [Thermocarpiscus australiensis]